MTNKKGTSLEPQEATQEIFFKPFQTLHGDTAIMELTEYFLPKKSVDYANSDKLFKRRVASEMVDQLATSLWKLAANCEFHGVDQELKVSELPVKTSETAFPSSLSSQSSYIASRPVKLKQLEWK